MRNLYGDNIVPVPQTVGNSVTENGVPGWPFAEVIAVAPDLAVFINAVKTDVRWFSLPIFRRTEHMAIPAGSSGKIPRAA
jgi:hypothetical protein